METMVAPDFICNPLKFSRQHDKIADIYLQYSFLSSTRKTFCNISTCDEFVWHYRLTGCNVFSVNGKSCYCSFHCVVVAVAQCTCTMHTDRCNRATSNENSGLLRSDIAISQDSQREDEKVIFIAGLLTTYGALDFWWYRLRFPQKTECSIQNVTQFVFVNTYCRCLSLFSGARRKYFYDDVLEIKTEQISRIDRLQFTFVLFDISLSGFHIRISIG